MQRELNEARAADSVLDDSFAGRSRSIPDGPSGPCDPWNVTQPLTPVGRAGLYVGAEARIQGEVAVGSVKARMVEEVEELSIETQGKALGQLESLEDAHIEADLEWTAEGVARAVGIGSLGKVAGRRW